ncbi:MAG: hypothetical protein IKK59_04925 [Lachnospiraceae bacterium]|nr:hypothetical protein [Lachnospiraceae bacterium]
MKHNLLTAVLASIMVLMATGILLFGMTVYEKDQFEESWLLTPTVIEKELKPLYSEEFDENSTEY